MFYMLFFLDWVSGLEKSQIIAARLEPSSQLEGEMRSRLLSTYYMLGTPEALPTIQSWAK